MTFVGALVVLLGVLLPAGVAGAVESPRVDIDYQDGVLRFSLEALVAGRKDRIETLLYDYDQLDELFPTVVESRRLYAPTPGVERVRQRLRGCAMGVCHEFQHVADVRRAIDGSAQAVIVSGHGVANPGLVVWQINPGPGCAPRVVPGESVTPCGVTLLRLDGELRLPIVLPPWVGPALVRHVIRRHFIESLERLEAVVRVRSDATPYTQKAKIAR